ncbi:MAG: hypothetical protein ACTHKT_09310 [Solirubrobacterales bacterium]
MTNRRAKLAAGATVVGLAALGGVALGTNPGPTAIQQAQSGSGQAAVVTSASGAATLATTQNAALNSKQAPIVTRASGAPATRIEDD